MSESTNQQRKNSILQTVEAPWYSLLDFLEGKGLPVYNVIDPIDERIPSVLVAIGILILLLGGILFLLLGTGGGQETITLKVTAFS